MFLSWLLHLLAPDDLGVGGPPASGQGNHSSDPPPASSGASPDAGQGDNSGDDGSGSQGDKRIMTKTDFEARIAKASRSAQRTLLRALGIDIADDADEDAIQAALDGLGELVDYAHTQRRAGLSAEQQVRQDLDDAITAASTAEERRVKAERERDEMLHTLTAFVRRSYILEAADGAENPEDEFLWAQAYMPDSVNDVLVEDQPLFRDDGTLNGAVINHDAIKLIIEECRKERRSWWQPRSGVGSPSNAGAQPPGAGTDLAAKRQQAKNILRGV